MLGENTNAIKKNTETVLEAGRDVGLEANTEKTKYGCHATRMQDNHNLLMG
jgi:hypothetical protein